MTGCYKERIKHDQTGGQLADHSSTHGLGWPPVEDEDSDIPF